MGLIHKQGRVIVKIDLDGKNFHTFQNGQTIRLEREYGNLNQREVRPVNAAVVSAESIPIGAEVLIHHNSTHDSNRIFDYGGLSGEIASDSVKYFSIPEEDCYAWIDEDGEAHPLKNFAFGLRVFKPYNGLIEGVEHTLLKNVLYLTTSDFGGYVVGTLKASDYEIVYQGKDGREKRLIRIRHSQDEGFEREEVIYVANDLTEKVNNNELYIGLTTRDAKPINTTTNEVKGSIYTLNTTP